MIHMSLYCTVPFYDTVEYSILRPCVLSCTARRASIRQALVSHYPAAAAAPADRQRTNVAAAASAANDIYLYNLHEEVPLAEYKGEQIRQTTHRIASRRASRRTYSMSTVFYSSLEQRENISHLAL